MVAQARTGTGKTLAYLLPLLHKLFASDLGPKTRVAPAAFILVPTRELCQQVLFGVFDFGMLLWILDSV